GGTPKLPQLKLSHRRPLRLGSSTRATEVVLEEKTPTVPSTTIPSTTTTSITREHSRVCCKRRLTLCTFRASRLGTTGRGGDWSLSNGAAALTRLKRPR